MVTVDVRHRIYRDMRVLITLGDDGLSYTTRQEGRSARFDPAWSTPTKDRHRFWQEIVPITSATDRKALALFIGLK